MLSKNCSIKKIGMIPVKTACRLGLDVPHQVNMQPYCKSNYDNAYEIAQRPQKQLKREQYVAGVVSGDNNELYQHLSNKFGHTIMDKSTTTHWLQSKDWRKMVSLHQAVSSESETITRSQQQYLLRTKTRNYEYIYKTIDGTYSQRKYEMTTDRDRDIAKYKRIDLIHLLKWQELNLEETIDSITTYDHYEPPPSLPRAISTCSGGK